MISLYKQMTEVLQSIGDDFKFKIQQYNNDLEEHDKARRASFQILLTQVDEMKAGLSKMWRGAAGDVGAFHEVRYLTRS